jgi:hypothetical protein
MKLTIVHAKNLMFDRQSNMTAWIRQTYKYLETEESEDIQLQQMKERLKKGIHQEIKNDTEAG